MAIHQSKIVARFALAMTAFTGIGALIAFATLLGVQVTAQQQMTQAENHHPTNSSSNQFGIGSTAEQRQNTTATTVGGGMMIMNQTSNMKWISLVRGVNVSGISIIDNEHIAINLRYDGEGEPPGVSVVAMISRSSDTIIVDSMMQNSTSTSASNSGVGIMQSGSNYLEARWQVQDPSSATILVQLDGDMPEGGGHIMVIVVPFLHH
jgi:hypothetical protein